MKLFLVRTRFSLSFTSTDYSKFYVLAKDPTHAYKVVRSYLDDKRAGICQDREMYSIELVAEVTDYPDCKTICLLG